MQAHRGVQWLFPFIYLVIFKKNGLFHYKHHDTEKKQRKEKRKEKGRKKERKKEGRKEGKKERKKEKKKERIFGMILAALLI